MHSVGSQKFGSSHSSSGMKAGGRSLKDALSDAGFGEFERDGERTMPRARAQAPQVSLPSTEDDTLGETVDTHAATPSRATSLFNAEPAGKKAHTPSSVVSPPPWLRAAQRGRRHARLTNTFGWLVTLIVAGSIIGAAGRYLAVAPGAFEHAQQARQ